MLNSRFYPTRHIIIYVVNFLVLRVCVGSYAIVMVRVSSQLEVARVLYYAGSIYILEIYTKY